MDSISGVIQSITNSQLKRKYKSKPTTDIFNDSDEEDLTPYVNNKSATIGIKDGESTFEIPELRDKRKKEGIQREDGHLWENVLQKKKAGYEEDWMSNQEQRLKLLRSNKDFKFVESVAGALNQRVENLFEIHWDAHSIDTKSKRSEQDSQYLELKKLEEEKSEKSKIVDGLLEEERTKSVRWSFFSENIVKHLYNPWLEIKTINENHFVLKKKSDLITIYINSIPIPPFAYNNDYEFQRTEESHKDYLSILPGILDLIIHYIKKNKGDKNQFISTKTVDIYRKNQPLSNDAYFYTTIKYLVDEIIREFKPPVVVKSEGDPMESKRKLIDTIINPNLMLHIESSDEKKAEIEKKNYPRVLYGYVHFVFFMSKRENLEDLVRNGFLSEEALKDTDKPRGLGYMKYRPKDINDCIHEESKLPWVDIWTTFTVMRNLLNKDTPLADTFINNIGRSFDYTNNNIVKLLDPKIFEKLLEQQTNIQLDDVLVFISQELERDFYAVKETLKINKAALSKIEASISKTIEEINLKNKEIEYKHRREWVETPENSGLVTLIPLIKQAIDISAREVKLYIREFARVDSETLQTDNLIMPEFAQLVAVNASMIEQQNPKMYYTKETHNLTKINKIKAFERLRRYRFNFGRKEFQYKDV